MSCFLRLSDWTISVYMLSKMQLISDSNWLVLLYPQAFALRSVLGLRFCSHFWTVFASTIPSPRPFHWYVVFSHFVFGRNLESSFQEWGTCGQKSYTVSYFMKGVLLGALWEKINQTCKHFGSFRYHLNVTSQRGFHRTQYLDLPLFTIIHSQYLHRQNSLFVKFAPFSPDWEFQVCFVGSWISGLTTVPRLLASSKSSIHVYWKND